MQGIVPRKTTPAEFTAFVASESKKFADHHREGQDQAGDLGTAELGRNPARVTGSTGGAAAANIGPTDTQEDRHGRRRRRSTQPTADQHSHVVKPAEMEWKPTRFPGCEVKTLLYGSPDRVMTALMRFAPGAVLPDHEHVNIEQTYVLEGRLVDKEGPAEGIEAGPASSSGARSAAATWRGAPRAG